MNSLLLFCLLWFPSPPQVDSTPYNISFHNSTGNIIDMSAYQGKKILIAVFDPAQADRRELSVLDSLSRAQSSSLVVLGVPANDLGASSTSGSQAVSITHPMDIGSFSLLQPAKVQKSAGESQHPLLKWLTHSAANGHFGEDAQNGRLFLINESGNLVGVLGKKSLYDQQYLQQLLND
jgi:glutathione peroxidase